MKHNKLAAMAVLTLVMSLAGLRLHAADTDQDTIIDPVDNCDVSVNPDQMDNDRDGNGDVCDTDDDNDGVEDQLDNCALTYNPAQADDNMDGIGNVCDATYQGDEGHGD